MSTSGEGEPSVSPRSGWTRSVSPTRHDGGSAAPRTLEPIRAAEPPNLPSRSFRRFPRFLAKNPSMYAASTPTGGLARSTPIAVPYHRFLPVPSHLEFGMIRAYGPTLQRTLSNRRILLDTLAGTRESRVASRIFRFGRFGASEFRIGINRWYRTRQRPRKAAWHRNALVYRS